MNQGPTLPAAVPPAPDLAAPGGGPWPLVVVGAGAAGLLAAIHAAEGGAPTLLLETRPRPGAKIRVSGGGRCNLLPSRSELADFRTQGSPHKLRNLLASWPLEAVRAFFERELAIPLKVEATGKVFPVSEDPREVVEALLARAARVGVRLVSDRRVVALRREADRFTLDTERGESLRAERVLLATGGLSLPKTGSDGGGLRLATGLGHELLPDYPALVPLLARDARWGELAGISLVARLRAVRAGRLVEEREGDLLFTHRGFSGPVVLDMSLHCSAPGSEGTRLCARWLGSGAPPWDERLRAQGKRTVGAVLREALPRRLALLLCDLARVDAEKGLSELAREERRRLVAVLEDCPLELAGNEGYRTAEVTGGGIPLADLHTRSLESRRVPGLYFAGEIVDVTGRIGGFNFLWAWVSGRIAGAAAAASYRETNTAQMTNQQPTKVEFSADPPAGGSSSRP